MYCKIFVVFDGSPAFPFDFLLIASTQLLPFAADAQFYVRRRSIDIDSSAGIAEEDAPAGQ
jgi:hypothetical protein